MDDGERTPSPGRHPGSPLLVASAGLLGLAGVAVSAAAAHRGGGDLARTAGLFALIHAAAALGLAAFAWGPASASRVLRAAGYLLVGGAVVFCGDLAFAGLADWRPLPAAAPLGGALLMAGWLGVLVGGALAARPGR